MNLSNRSGTSTFRIKNQPPRSFIEFLPMAVSIYHNLIKPTSAKYHQDYRSMFEKNTKNTKNFKSILTSENLQSLQQLNPIGYLCMSKWITLEVK